MLYVTNIRNIKTDIEYQEFIKICNEVLPLKIETSYINLANSIDEYLNALAMMDRNDFDATGMAIQSEKASNEINNYSKVESNISKKVKEIAQKETYSQEDYEKLMKLAQMGKSFISKMKDEKAIVDNNQHETIKKNVASSAFQNDIPNIILNITNILRLVSELDSDGNKRLDNLEIRPTHINQVSGFNIDGKEKEHALDLLNEFLETRKNAFRIIEEFAFHILEKYQKRETIFSKDLYEKYRLSSMALEALELGEGVFSKGNFIFNDFYSDKLLTTSKIYNSYMNGEDISPETFREAWKKPMDDSCYRLIIGVESAVKRQPNNGFNM